MKNLVTYLLMFFSCICLQAQEATNNTGNLQVHSGASITAFGNVTNTTTGALVNNGSLYIKGNLTNNQASMSTGTGTLYLNGSSAQSIAGSEIFKTYNLTTSNSSGITLNNDLSVSGTHTFTAGDIASSVTPNYLIYESGSGYSGAGDAAHVTGWVKKIGNSGFTFPTGNGTYLREIAISNLSASSEFNAAYKGATTNTSNVQLPLVVINPNEYWEVNKISGGTAQVTLNWDDSKVSFPNWVLASIRSAQYISSNWTSTGGSATGDVTTTGSITSTALSTFGALSIGSESFVVPLDFLNITANRKQGFTDVQWKTANEINVKEHQVQRSTNALNFNTIGKTAAINTVEDHVYNFYDSDNIYGVVYYRIKSVDYDGKTKYSKVVSVANNNSTETIAIKNNPVMGTIHLSLSSATPSSFNYQLIATNGSIAQQGNIRYGGTGSLVIDLHANIVAGSYILTMNDGKILFTQKIIVQ